jgi:hypothetical protein
MEPSPLWVRGGMELLLLLLKGKNAKLNFHLITQLVFQKKNLI